VREQPGRGYAPSTTTSVSTSLASGTNVGGGGAVERVTTSRSDAALARARSDPKVVACPHLQVGGGGGGPRATLLRTVHRGEGSAYTSSLYCGACEARLEERRQGQSTVPLPAKSSNSFMGGRAKPGALVPPHTHGSVSLMWARAKAWCLGASVYTQSISLSHATHVCILHSDVQWQHMM